MKRLILLAVLVIIALAFVLPAQAHRPQILADVILRAGTTEAKVSFSTVDASKIRKLSAKDFRQGMTIVDDAGRIIRVSGRAVIEYQGRHFQEFKLTGVRIGKGTGRRVEVTHLFLGVFSGSDWAHWYDDGYVCSSPQMTVKACVRSWKVFPAPETVGWRRGGAHGVMTGMVMGMADRWLAVYEVGSIVAEAA